jgi:hypothetical protein
MMRKAFESQLRGEGFSFVEILTMCPTGWFVPTAEGPGYMDDTLGQVHTMGELKAGPGGRPERVASGAPAAEAGPGGRPEGKAGR